MKNSPRSRARFALVATILLASFDCLAARRLADVGNYTVFQWTAEDGLPQNTVRGILQSRDGYLWVATGEGVARFDGAHFKAFNSSNQPDMINDDCVSLAQDSQGTVFIGTRAGLARWQNSRFSVIHPVPLGLAGDNIRFLSPGRPNGLWVGTENGLYFWTGEQFTSFTTKDGLAANNVRAVFQCSHGEVWVGSEMNELCGTLQIYRPASRTCSSVPRQAEDLYCMTHCFAEPSPGHVWWGNNRGLHEAFGGDVRDYGLTNGLSGGVVKSIAPSAGGGLWVITGARAGIPGRAGLHYFLNGHALRLDLSPTGIEEDLICVSEDREQNVWVGTRNDGLLRLRRRRATTILMPGEPNRNKIYSVCAVPDGSVWIAAGALFQLAGTNLIPRSDASTQPLFRSVYASPQGKLLAGEQTGVCAFCGGEVIREPGYGGQASVRVIYQDRTGRSWLADDSKVTAGTFGNLNSFTWGKWFSNSPCFSILQDSQGSMWFGTHGGGLFHYSVHKDADGKFQLEPPGPGAPLSGATEPLAHLGKENGFPSDTILCLFEDAEGVLWIGTDKGLCCLRGNRLGRASTEQGLFDNHINCLLEDEPGHFWIGCNRGIFRVDRHEVLDVMERRTPRVHCLVIGQADGMRNSEIPTESQPAASKGPDGRLWFATGSGVVVIDPAAVVQNSNPPPVLIEEVRAAGRTFSGTPSSPSNAPQEEYRLRLPEGSGRQVEIQYTANSLAAPDRVRFRVRLEPEDREDTTTDERVARYNNLRPGNYRFFVTACNNDGVWNTTGAWLAISIAPHFYQTRWFMVVAGAAILAMVAAVQGYRLRWYRQVFKLEHQRALASERSRIARDIHDDLGSRFLQISVLSELADRAAEHPHESRAHLGQLRAATGQVFQALDEVVWAANPKHDSLEGLVSYMRQYAPQFLAPAGIHCRLDFPDPLPDRSLGAEMRHEVFMAIKEALQNVVKHAQATEVKLGLDGRETGLSFYVRDNGRGFDPAQVRSRGDGLGNMRHRVESIGGKWSLRSAPGQGTEISIQLPV